MDAQLVSNIRADIGFFLPDWRVSFRPLKKRYGQTLHSTQEITMSTYLVEKGTIANIRTTMLHEIAHAKVGEGHHHDRVWQAMALSLGIPTDATFYFGDVLPHRYELRCPICHSKLRLNRKGKWYRWGKSGKAKCIKDGGLFELWDIKYDRKLN